MPPNCHNPAVVKQTSHKTLKATLGYSRYRSCSLNWKMQHRCQCLRTAVCREGKGRNLKQSGHSMQTATGGVMQLVGQIKNLY